MFESPRKRQIRLQEEMIRENERTLAELTRQYEEMKRRIAQIEDKYAFYTEFDKLHINIDALKETLAKLQREVDDKTLELDILREKIKIAKEIDTIKEMRAELALERKELQTFKDNNIPVSDVIIGIYPQNKEEDDNYDGLYLANAFYLLDRVTFEELDDEEVAVYQSLGKDLIAMISYDTGESIYDDSDYDTEDYSANIELTHRFTFSEICIMVNSPVYLNGTVSPFEIHEVLQAFRKGYKIKADSDGDIRVTPKNSTKRTRQK